MGRKSGIISESLVIISSILVIVSIVFQSFNLASNYHQFIENNEIKVTIALLMIVGLLSFQIIISILMWREAKTIVYFVKKKKHEIKILSEKLLHVGDYLIFEIKYSGFLLSGYFELEIKGAYGELERIRFDYDESTNLGRIEGPFNEKIFTRRWAIPSTYNTGEYGIRIIVYDVHLWFGIKKLRQAFELYYIKSTFVIAEPPKKTLEIKKIVKPHLKVLKAIDLNAKPMSGWICIKVYNDTDMDYPECYGHVMIDDDQFTLFDYEKFLRNGKNQDIDAYASFSIARNATKLLYADVKTDKNLVKISIDIGKEEIVKELPLKFDS